MSSSSSLIEQCQFNLLEKYLFNTIKSDTTWKILIYDDYCQQIIAPLFDLQSLRNKYGVTLNLHINDINRDEILDVPVIYICEPLDENINQICNDIKLCKYNQFYLYFSSHITREQLELIASTTIKYANTHYIIKIIDLYCNFIINQNNFINLYHTSSYLKLHSTNDDILMSYIDQIVNQLFSILVTIQQIPLIYSQSENSASAMISQKLCKKIYNHLQSTNNLFKKGGLSNSGSGFSGSLSNTNSKNQRCVLMLIDRDFNLSTMLHHPWTYQALIHDIYNIKKSCCVIDNTQYELYSKNDTFWLNNQHQSFPNVAEAIQNSLQNYQHEIKQIEIHKQGQHGPNQDVESLQQTIHLLPKLQLEKKP